MDSFTRVATADDVLGFVVVPPHADDTYGVPQFEHPIGVRLVRPDGGPVLLKAIVAGPGMVWEAEPFKYGCIHGSVAFESDGPCAVHLFTNGGVIRGRLERTPA